MSNRQSRQDVKLKVFVGYSGSGSFSKVAKERGHELTTCDANPEWIANNFDLVQLSPMCTTASLASGSTHWREDRTPKTVDAVVNRAHYRHCLKILEACNIQGVPCFIENPNGRIVWFLPDEYKKQITYCQYGYDYQKTTNIYTNSSSWIPRKKCKRGDKCHIPAPRGSKSGLQGVKGNYARSKMPPDLCESIIKAVEKDSSITYTQKLEVLA